MNNDFYSEQLVAKKSGGSETAKKILIGVLTALVAAFLFLIIIFPLSLLLVGLVFYGGYYLMTGIDTEYEYILTNGDLDIDKITGAQEKASAQHKDRRLHRLRQAGGSSRGSRQGNYRPCYRRHKRGRILRRFQAPERRKCPPYLHSQRKDHGGRKDVPPQTAQS